MNQTAYRTVIRGTGSYLPEGQITNKYLESIVIQTMNGFMSVLVLNFAIKLAKINTQATSLTRPL